MDKYTIKDLELFYGDFKALKNINLNIQEKENHSIHILSPDAASRLLKTLNRMNDLVEGCRITGSVPDGRTTSTEDRRCQAAKKIAAWFSRSRILSL